MTDNSPHGNDDAHRPDDAADHTTPETGSTGAAESVERGDHPTTPLADISPDHQPTTPIDDRPRYGERLPGYGADGSYTAQQPTVPQPTAQQAPAQQPGDGVPRPQYPAQNPYGEQGSPYGQQAPGQQAPGQQNPYGGSSQYGQSGQYGQQNPYGQSSQYGRPDQHAPQSAPYGQQSYDQSAQQPASAPYGQQSSQQPTSAYDAPQHDAPSNGSYFAGASPTATARPANPNRTRLVLALLGMLVIGAIIGGLAGGGIGAAVAGNNAGSTTTSGGSQSGGHLTVNDYNSATVVTAVAAKATPSVVTINVTASSEAGTGSGVILSKDGYIVTNTHVVTLDGDSSKGTIQVTTSDGKIYKGTLVGTDPTVDLAVVKIDASGLTPIEFADSSKLNVGDTAVAIGAPLGLSNTVTDGIVSTLNRSIQVASSAPSDGSSGDSNQGEGNNGSGPYDFWGNGDNGSSSGAAAISLPVIQTDAAINPGNSGGALLDSKGKLIGINVAIASASSSSSSSDSQSGSIGVGFAIPANLADRVANEIIKNGKATHGLLGATVGDATDDANATQMGAVIKSTTGGGAAAAAGLQKGDVVTALGGVTVTDATDLTAQVRFLAGGSKTTVTYVRNGTSHTADVTLGTYSG